MLNQIKSLPPAINTRVRIQSPTATDLTNLCWRGFQPETIEIAGRSLCAAISPIRHSLITRNQQPPKFPIDVL